MLRLAKDVKLQMLDHCNAGVPNEACGLLAGTTSDEAVECYPTRNAAASPKIYEVEPVDYLHADRDAETKGMELIGVFHSHTHTEGYPSQTDVRQAPDPNWHYLIISLRDAEPVVRSFRIVNQEITEEPLEFM